MGAVDLVLQVESPKSVTAGLQRIGRAGHNVGDVSKGRIFPKFRADLLECAVVARRMRDGEIETTVVPRNPLDVLAQQIVAMVATGDDWRVPELHELVRRAYPFSELSREMLDQVLDMLDGRYPSEEFAELRPRIVWDRVEDTIRARKGALQLAVTNAGTIPDRGLYGVHLPDGRRVGELDEEMVYEARPGQTFLLGASAWRIEEITRDRVIVTPAPGAPGALPYWKGDGVGRPKELGQAIGEFSRTAIDMEPAELAAEYSLDERAARNLLTYLREQREATRVVPSDRTIVVERFRDEIGDWRLCVLTPFGGRVHAAWGLALSARIRDEFGLESDAIWSDDGIIVHLPDADEPPGSELVLVEPDEVEELVVRELSSSALFGARFRENAARALLLPRAYPGKRTPLWQQRLKAQSLLEVAKGYGQFPIVLETYRECLRDVLDLPGLEELLRGLHTRELSLVEAETQRASPFASSLLFDYVATYMYEGDTPNAERRAAALSLDRDLLRELLGQEELRDLIDANALDEVEADLQRLSERTRAANSDGLHDVLRAVGDLTVDEAQERCLPAVSARRMLDDLERERRAVSMRIGGEDRFIASEDAGLYRDALGAVPARRPARRVPRRAGGSARAHPAPLRAHARAVHDARGRRPLPDGPRPGAARARARRPPDPRRAAPRRLRARVVRPRCAAPPAPGLAGHPAQGGRARRAARAGALPSRVAGRGHGSARGRRRRSPARDPRAAPGGGAGAGGLGARRAPAARRAPTRPRGWTSCAPAGSWCGWGPGRSGVTPARWRCTSATTPAGSGRRRTRATPPRSRSTRRSASGCAAEPRSGPTCWPTSRSSDGSRVEPVEIQEALWDLVWAGEVTNDAFAPLRSPRLSLAREQRDSGRRFARRRRPGAPQVQGRWSLTEPLFAGAPAHGPKMRALSEVLLERFGIVTRETVLAEGVPGGFAALYSELANLETLGTARRGYFVEGLGGAQFALPAAIERLRGLRADTLPSRRGRWCWAPPTPPIPSAPRCPGPARRRPQAEPRAGRLRGHPRLRAGALRGARRQGPDLPARPAGGRAARGVAASGARGAGRPRAPRSGQAAGHRALRRRARRGLSLRAAAGGGGLPAGPAPADAQRVTPF